MKDAHARKGAHNQALLREVNERIVRSPMTLPIPNSSANVPIPTASR